LGRPININKRVFAKRMDRERIALLTALIASIIAFFGNMLFEAFIAIVSVFSDTVGIILVAALAVSSLFLSQTSHQRFKLFITHERIIHTLSMLTLLITIVWLLFLFLPQMTLLIEEVDSISRPIWQSVILLIVSFIVLMRSGDYAVDKATEFARILEISPFVISFFVIGIVSALPESSIALITNMRGDPNGAASALLGSNIADLALIFGVIAMMLRGSTVTSEALKKDSLYLGILFLPFILMLDGNLTHLDGSLLLVSGLFFFGIISYQSNIHKIKWRGGIRTVLILMQLIGSLMLMLFAANVTVDSASDLGKGLGIPLAVVNVVVVGIGACLPELVFVMKSAMKNNQGLAIGNILSVVMIDATIMLGLIALLRPMTINPSFFFVTNLFMVITSVYIVYTMRVVQRFSWQEGTVFLSIYGLYLFMIIKG